MDGRRDAAVEALLEHLIEHGPDDIATVFGRAFELAMRIERETEGSAASGEPGDQCGHHRRPLRQSSRRA